MAKRGKRLTLTIPPPLAAGECDAACPLYYVVMLEGNGVFGSSRRAWLRGCAGGRGVGMKLDVAGIRELRPGPRCPWGQKGDGR